jgi:hypothetical protein
MVDAVVVVARAGLTTPDALLAAKQRFLQDRIHVPGAVLNNWDPKRHPDGYYGRIRKVATLPEPALAAQGW